MRFTRQARDDLMRLYDFLLERDLGAAERAIEAIEQALRLACASPFTCRIADAGHPFLRELVIPFGSSGYVALLEIAPRRTINVLAVRHQREEDFF